MPDFQFAPLFSIILPTYNRAHYLYEAIHSVVQQTYGHWELIIVDDGSTDNTLEIVNRFPDRRIRYFRQKNKGRSEARNTGLHHALGDYLTFLDDDDYYLPDHLTSFAGLLGAPPREVIIKTEGFRKSSKLVPIPICPTGYREALRYIWQRGPNLMFFAFPASAFENRRFDPRITYPEDFHVIMDALPDHPLAFTQKRTVVLREHAYRTLGYLDEPGFQRLFFSMKTVLDNLTEQHSSFLSKNLGEKEIDRKYQNTHLFLANRAARIRLWEQTIRHCSFAVKTGGIHFDLIRKIIAISWRLVQASYLKKR